MIKYCLVVSSCYSLLYKEEELTSEGNLQSTTYYKYDKGKLISKKHISEADASRFNELIYTFDNLGQEIQWIKVFNGKDTSVAYTSRYQGTKLLEKIGSVHGKIDSKEYYQYSNDKLSSIKQHNAEGVLKISSQYYYDKLGRVDYIDEVNDYMRLHKRIKYYY